MRNNICIMLFFLGICSISCVAENLISNGNFAEIGPDNKAAAWEVWPEPLNPQAEVEIDGTMSRSAGRSMRITHHQSDLYSRIQQLKVKCKPHTKYVASFYAKGARLNIIKGGGASMFIGPDGDLMYAISSFGPRFDFFNLDPKPEYWTFDWKRYESPVFNSGTSQELGIAMLLVNAGGTVWFDNIEIMEYTPELEKEREAGLARKLLRRDLAVLRQNADKNPDVLMKTEEFTKHLEKWYPEKLPDAKNGVPFYQFQEEIIALNALLLQKNYPGQSIIISSADPLHPQEYLATKFPSFSGCIELDGVRLDSESFGLNFTNCTALPITVNLETDGKLLLEIRQVVDIETDSSRCVDDALVRLRSDADGKFNLMIPGGITRQLYFAVTLPSQEGLVESNLKWNYGDQQGSILIRQQTYSIDFPQEMLLKTFSYSYLYRFGLDKKLDASIRRLRSMHQNARTLFQFHSPQPVFDDTSKIQPEKMDWSKADAELQLMMQPGMVIVYLPVHSDPHLSLFLGKKNGQTILSYSPEWEYRISQYLKVLVKGFQERGLGYDRLLITLLDEPPENHVEYMVRLAKLIKKTDPQLRIYNNFHYALSLPAIKLLAENIDIVAPEVNMITPDRMKILRESGKEIWCYWVQNKTIPGNIIRELFPKIAAEGITGFSYWCFRDQNKEWRPMGMQSYSVVYDGDPDEWIPSKRSEGIREGIEDYTLLQMLKKRHPVNYRSLIDKITPENWLQIRKQVLNILQS